MDELFGNTTVLNEVKVNMRVQNLTTNSIVGRTFIPIASFASNYTDDKLNEFLAIIEGINFPFFGIAFSIEKIVYNIDPSVE